MIFLKITRSGNRPTVVTTLTCLMDIDYPYSAGDAHRSANNFLKSYRKNHKPPTGYPSTKCFFVLANGLGLSYF